MFCTQCGQSVEPGDKFCWDCGAPIKRRSDSVAPASSARIGGPILNVFSPVDKPLPVAAPATAASQPVAESSFQNAAVAFPEAQPQESPAVAAPPPPSGAVPEQPQRISDIASSPMSVAQEPQVASRDEVSLTSAEEQAAAPQLAPSRDSSQPGNPKVPEEVLYDSCGTELVRNGRSLDLGHADIPTPSFGGYAAAGKAPRANVTQREGAKSARIAATSAANSNRNLHPAEIPRRKSLLPVLEVLVVLLLLFATGAVFVMLRSSSPAKLTTPAPIVNVAISPSAAEVTAGKAFDFVATITGTDDPRVSWTVQEGEAGGRVVTHGSKVEGEAVSSTAVYIAPSKPGTYHLLAASEANLQKTTAAEIRVIKR